ncbi:MAG: endonuclease/exonuclease/phosphatase family protein [Acidobacteriota bacterium]
MADIKIAFWNLQNLFDTTLSELAADFEFTPAEGWNEAALDAKLTNLAEIINLMHAGEGPDLLGICEVENKNVAQLLIDKTGRADYKLAHIESPDIRGIDTSLIYSENVFHDPQPADMKAHNVFLRFPTRDIFEVHLRVKANDAELRVLVNHWPSRRQGQYESEPHRITVAEHCGRLIDGFLKFSRQDYPPDTAAGLAEINERWNRNVLVMGDLNDEPFNRSVLDYLQGTKDLDHLEEEIKKAAGRQTPHLRDYLGKRAYLFNCCWPFFAQPDRGTHFFSPATNSMGVLDQFLISRGLFYGEQKLKLSTDTVQIFTPEEMTSTKGRPVAFDKEKKRGYSDHFPITAVVKTV